MNDWDPIGIKGIPEASDEYDTYSMPIYGILRHGRSKDRLLDYLHWMTENMGLTASRFLLKPIAATLLQIDLSHDEQHE